VDPIDLDEALRATGLLRSASHSESPRVFPSNPLEIREDLAADTLPRAVVARILPPL
jgi:hypothetical protein